MNKTLERLLLRKHRACYLKYISLIHAIEVKTIVEIGVFKGKNAKVLREEFPNAHLFLIDPWLPDPSYLESGGAVSQDSQVFEKARAHTLSLFENDPQVTIIEKTSLAAASEIPDDLDLVFIDANHSYEHVKQDILTWKPKVRSGGILSGHNYGRSRLPGVKQAVDEFFPNIILGQDEVWLHFVSCSK